MAWILRVQKYQIYEHCMSVGKGTIESKEIRNSSIKRVEVGKGNMGAGKLAMEI